MEEQEQEPDFDQSLAIETGKAIGANTDYLSAQSFTFQQQERTFLYLIAASGEDVFAQIKSIGLDCRDSILTKDQLIPELIPEALDFIKTEAASLENLQVVLVGLKHDILYCSLIAGGQIFLLRHGRLTELSKNITSEKIISGQVQPGDKVLVINNPIPTEGQIKLWDPIFLQDLLETPVDQLEEEMEAYLQRFQLDSPAAVAALEIPAPEPPVDDQPIPNITSPLREAHPQPKTPFLPFLLIKTLVRELLQSPKVKLILAVTVVILIILAIFGVSQFRKQSQNNAQIQAFLTSSKQDLDHAVGIKDSDQDGARASFTKAKQELQAALKIDPGNNSAKNLQKDINAQSGAILKEFQVTDFPVFLDLSLVKTGFSTRRLSFSLGKMAFLDPKQKTLVVLDVVDKNPKILAGQLQLGDAQFASINGNQVFVYSGDKGVLSVDIGNGKVTTAAKPDPQWQRISDIAGFANNVYLLDEFKNQVWKYIATDTGFSTINNYLRDGVTADFAGIKKMQIDGSIWVLKSNNTILKFIQGGSDFFAFQGFEVPMANIKSFYVSDDTDNIYFLDNDNGRVVVTKKNGQFLGEYTGDKFKTADDLAVDENGKKLYLLEAGKIYLIELQ